MRGQTGDGERGDEEGGGRGCYTRFIFVVCFCFSKEGEGIQSITGCTESGRFFWSLNSRGEGEGLGQDGCRAIVKRQCAVEGVEGNGREEGRWKEGVHKESCGKTVCLREGGRVGGWEGGRPLLPCAQKPKKPHLLGVGGCTRGQLQGSGVRRATIATTRPPVCV